MTGTTGRPTKVVLAQYAVTDTEIHRVQVVRLDCEDPLLQVVRRWLDERGAVEERVTQWAGRERLEEVLEDPSWETERKRALRIREALRLMEEAEQAREAEEAEALQSEQASAPAPCEEGPGLPETPPASEPEGQAVPGDPVPPQPPNGQSDPGAAHLREDERRARNEQFVAEAGQRIRSARPLELLPGDWFHMLLEELDWESWWAAYDDPRIQRGNWDHVWEAMHRANVRAAAARAAAQDPRPFGISGEVVAGNYPTRNPKPAVGSFEHRFAIRCPLEVPEREWRQRILERLGYADWGALAHDAERCTGGWPAVRGKLSEVQDDLFMEMQHIEIQH